MQRCLDLAAMAWPACRPNPMVGAVLVKDNRILSEGFTQTYGGPHAEVMALREIGEVDLFSAVLYVSLEPCAHHGKTPPCVDLILKKGIGKVVIGTRDPFKEVDGRGIEKLRQHGVEVILDVLEEKCRFQNRRFFTFHEKKRPYVILKWAQTKDGFIDSLRMNGSALKITSALASQYVHRWRAEEMAILVGGETYRKDSPRLTTRLVEGPDPVPIIWSKALKKDELRLEHQAAGIISSADSVAALLEDLFQKGIQSVLVEGGANVIESFLKSGIYDEVRRFSSEAEIGEGIKGPLWEAKHAQQEMVGVDLLDWEIRQS